MTENTRTEESSYELVHNKGYNPAAMAATLRNLDQEQTRILFGDWGKDWTEVDCDGSKVLVLKKPTKAFEFYATTWTAKFNALIEVLNQIKVKVGVDSAKKIEKLFADLNYMDAEIRQMYYSSYLTFMATACSEKSQEEKRKMDRIIAAATMYLVSYRMMLESMDAKDLDKINEQMINLLNKISDLITKSS